MNQKNATLARASTSGIDAPVDARLGDRLDIGLVAEDRLELVGQRGDRLAVTGGGRHAIQLAQLSRDPYFARNNVADATSSETSPAKEFEAQMGDSRIFVLAAFKSLWGHYAPDA